MKPNKYDKYIFIIEPRTSTQTRSSQTVLEVRKYIYIYSNFLNVSILLTFARPLHQVIC